MLSASKRRGFQAVIREAALNATLSIRCHPGYIVLLTDAAESNDMWAPRPVVLNYQSSVKNSR